MKSASFKLDGVMPGRGESSAAEASVKVTEAHAPVKEIIRSLFMQLESRNVRFSHWKSNIRLDETLAGGEDIDLLVHRRDAALFHATLAELGFKLAQSRTGLGHPGVFHALGLDAETGELAHLHAYHQIVSGDSLVKNYRLQIEDVILDQPTHLLGIRVPTPEAELVLFALRIALKHVSPIEIAMANRGYHKVSHEMKWLCARSDIDRATTLCSALFPTIEPELFGQLLDSIQNDNGLFRRILLGWKVAWRLREKRRLGFAAVAASRLRRFFFLILVRFYRRKDMVLQTGGLIVALVGPKATGKSTLGRELAGRLGQFLDVHRIHAGKPPGTFLTLLPRIFLPLARRLLQNERPQEYQKSERRQEKRYSMIFVLRMTMIAYERRKLLGWAQRTATAGGIVIADRYPSSSIGATDSSCFDDEALEKCASPFKRWLMKLERRLYRGLPKPDLIIRLKAPIEMTLQRDARRIKPGGPDSEAVQRRWDLETKADYFGLPETIVDTNRPLDETARDIVAKVWAAL
jgi:thymidylate kinase